MLAVQSPESFTQLAAYALVASIIPLCIYLAFFYKSFSPYPEYAFAAAPTIVTARVDEKETEQISIKTLLETKCPSLFTAFKPRWYLFNGHLQTIFCLVVNFAKVNPMTYWRTYLRLADGGTIGLDFAPADEKSLRDDAPIIVVQHGLSGGSYEGYLRVVLARACAPVEEGGLGYRACVINYRGCAGVPITSPMMYSAGHTDDTRQALTYIANKYPRARLIGIGFSLGANTLTRYMAEEKDKSRLHSGIALGCPWNMELNGVMMKGSFIGRNIYSKAMAGNLLNLTKRHTESFLRDPDHRVAEGMRQLLKYKYNAPTLDEFDHHFTMVAGGPAPHFPFTDVMDYYRWVSTHNILHHIKRPFLALSTSDDPVVRDIPMDAGDNGMLALGLTAQGGHIGWFHNEGHWTDRWTTKGVLEWMKCMAETIVDDFDQVEDRAEIYMDDAGFLREKGFEELGCKVIPGGGLFDGNNGEPPVDVLSC